MADKDKKPKEEKKDSKPKEVIDALQGLADVVFGKAFEVFDGVKEATKEVTDETTKKGDNDNAGRERESKQSNSPINLTVNFDKRFKPKRAGSDSASKKEGETAGKQEQTEDDN